MLLLISYGSDWQPGITGNGTRSWRLGLPSLWQTARKYILLPLELPMGLMPHLRSAGLRASVAGA